ncbi:inclusion body clearance protein IML2 [Apiospora arundinis]
MVNHVYSRTTGGIEDILSRFWEALIVLGVPVNSYCLTGDSPLGRVRASNHSLFLSLYEISREAETELCAPWIESSYLRTGHIRRTESILEAFKKVPGIAEIYGCGPLSLAKLSTNATSWVIPLYIWPSSIQTV